tara:strand:+ start:10570 stop:11481 length:912 start_codon:yes stop_codon:yes gene_type:complete
MFPSSILMLDDDPAFVEALSDVLENSFFKVIAFTDPENFKDHISLVSKKKELLINNNLEEVGYETHSITLSVIDTVRKYHEYFLNDFISCIVIDYDLSYCTGLNILENLNLKDHFPGRILLTGEADDKVAIEAFNNKKIDYFIHKSSEGLSKKIRQTVEDAVMNGFINMSMKSPLYSILCSTSFKVIYESEKFHSEFKSFLKEVDAIEYKIISLSGVFLIKSRKGNLYIYANISNDYDDLLKDDAEYLECDPFIKSVLDGKKFPLNIKGEKIFIESPENWKKAHDIKIVTDGVATFRVVKFKL